MHDSSQRLKHKVKLQILPVFVSRVTRRYSLLNVGAGLLVFCLNEIES